jgi:hypothetical protein
MAGASGRLPGSPLGEPGTHGHHLAGRAKQAFLSGLMEIKQVPLMKILLVFVASCLTVYYCVELHLGGLELLRFVVGALALWLPVGGWLYLLVRNEVPDRIVRIAFSAGGSYALTTLFYFAVATLHCNWLFYSVEAVAAAGLIYYAIKHRPAFESLLKHFRYFDWVLAALIAASMVASIPAQSVWRKDSQTGGMIYDGFPDHLYHVGQAYELSRHIPPQQAMIRGGTPERAYHHFMHLTTMLIDRYSGQPDMLRAHLIYHYAVIQILMCLLLYSIGKTLAGSRVAGYCTLALMYVAVAPAPNLWPVDAGIGFPSKTLPFYFFTVFPHLSSGLDIVTLALPQMYTGVLVLYAGLLGVLIVLERVYRGHQAPIVIFVTALVLATTMRFRVHVALAVLPAFLLMLLYLWRRTHQKVFLLAGFAAAVVAGLLYLEMRSPVYLRGTSNVRFGYSGLTASATSVLFSSWPFAEQVHEWLRRAIPQPEVMKWAWEVSCILMVSLLNVIGIPLLAATSVYLTSQRARRVFAPFNFLVFWAVVTSIGLAPILASDYDSFSLGGQFPAHARWYLFPFAGVALWWIARFFQKRFSWPAGLWICLALIVLVAGLLYRTVGPISALTHLDHENSVAIKAEDWPAFVYLREHTSPASVILTNRFWGFYFLVSGMSGRAAYQEIRDPQIESLFLDGIPRDDRVAIINGLWSATSDEQFSRLIGSTPITHILEFQDYPWPVHPPDCLTRLWENEEHTVIIWQVRRHVHL